MRTCLADGPSGQLYASRAGTPDAWPSTSSSSATSGRSFSCSSPSRRSSTRRASRSSSARASAPTSQQLAAPPLARAVCRAPPGIGDAARDERRADPLAQPVRLGDRPAQRGPAADRRRRLPRRPDLERSVQRPACDGVQVLIIAASADPDWSFAALETPQDKGKSVLRRRGGDIGGKTVKFIGWDRVWLTTGSQLCQAQLFKPPASASATVAAAPPPPPPTAGGGASAVARRHHERNPEGQRDRVQHRSRRRRQDPREPGGADASGAHRPRAGERQGRRHSPLRHPPGHAARRRSAWRTAIASRRSTASTWRARRRRSRRTRGSAPPTT